MQESSALKQKTTQQSKSKKTEKNNKKAFLITDTQPNALPSQMKR